MTKIRPERSSLISGTSTPRCRNVQIIPIRRKRGAGAARILINSQYETQMSIIRNKLSGIV